MATKGQILVANGNLTTDTGKGGRITSGKACFKVPTNTWLMFQGGIIIDSSLYVDVILVMMLVVHSWRILIS